MTSPAQRSWALVVSILMLGPTAGVAQLVEQPTPTRADQAILRSFQGDDLSGKDGPLAKMGWDLTALYHEYEAARARGEAPVFRPNLGMPGSATHVVIDAAASVGSTAAELRSALERLGMLDGAHYGRMVSGRLPIAQIPQAAALPHLHHARASGAATHGTPEWARGPDVLAGLTTSQGDVAQRSDIVRSTYGVDGTGVTIGTLSDTYDCDGTNAAVDVETGDLPSGVVVLDDDVCGTDEGRAMMQLIYDVAPGAAQQFHSANGGQAAFASGIASLVAAGSDIIVDDVSYFAEPMFQDGIIAQAADAAVVAGATYFSSAGNSARRSYEGPFRPSGLYLDIGFGDQEAHDFDPGPGVDIWQESSFFSPASRTAWILQWADPFFSVTGSAGAATDLDFCLSQTPSLDGLLACSTDPNQFGDPVEGLGLQGTGTLYLAILHWIGPFPNLMKYVWYGNSISGLEYATNSSTIYGHKNASHVEAVAAAFYYDTPAYGTDPPVPESFSSAGVTPILFTPSGVDTFDVRLKPEIMAPDGGNTTFFGTDVPDPGDGSDLDTYPNFKGTSAAAPHAAAVAALMKEAFPSLTPAEIYDAMEATALSVGSAALSKTSSATCPLTYDEVAGCGLIQADLIFEYLGTSELEIKLLLEGPYAGSGTMSTALNPSLPLNQPFSNLPWNYAGGEAMSSMPGTVVDWLLLELRTDTAAATTTSRHAVLLLNDGSVVDTSGTDRPEVEYPGIDSVFVVVRSRNHVDVMSVDKVDLLNDPVSIDLTEAASVFGTDPHKNVEGLFYALYAGDANGDGDVDASDFNDYVSQATLGALGYHSADYNNDGIVHALDFNLYLANTSAGATGQVP